MTIKEPEIDFENPYEFMQLWDDMAHKLQGNGRDALENPSSCCILRNKKFSMTEEVCKVKTKRLKVNEPQYCQIVDSKEVWAMLKRSASTYLPEEGYEYAKHVGFQGCWLFDPVLDKNVKDSGFSNVDSWLDNWSKSIADFELEKKYTIWLVKVIYPHTNLPIRILNDANKPIRT